MPNYEEEARLFAELFAAIAADDDERFDEAARKLEERIAMLEGDQGKEKEQPLSRQIAERVGKKTIRFLDDEHQGLDLEELHFCAQIARVLDDLLM